MANVRWFLAMILIVTYIRTSGCPATPRVRGKLPVRNANCPKLHDIANRVIKRAVPEDLEDQVVSAGDKFVKGASINHGVTGRVFRATIKATNQECAIKVVDPAGYKKDCPDRLSHDVAVLRAVYGKPGFPVLYYPDHAAATPEVAIGNDKNGKSYEFLVMSLLGPSLEELIERNKVSYQQLQHWIVQMTQAISTLHEKGFVHEDVTFKNVCIHRDHTNQAVLIDFSDASKPSVEEVTELMENDFWSLMTESTRVLKDHLVTQTKLKDRFSKGWDQMSEEFEAVFAGDVKTLGSRLVDMLTKGTGQGDKAKKAWFTDYDATFKGAIADWTK